ncbi:hypothetical protein Ahy_A01g002926 [Arachis hypogaea]|uniref:DUF1639 family protein n=1 Tax=Arachis hypogaea TaxID=3818 RepID=A0A445ES64_ARAHY|nr:hypothetical protein Ahy_A01g002926 [Arachis hypogaea]
MATAPLKSQPLHNFTLPFLKWGGTSTAKSHHATTSNNHHRFRRPVSDHEHDSVSDNRLPRVGSRPQRTNRYAVSPSNHHSNSHNQNQNKNHTPPLHTNISNTNNEHEAEDEEEKKHETEVAEAAGAEEAVQKPWNLRPRKQTAPAVTGGTSRSGSGERVEAANAEGGKSMRLRGMMAAMAGPAAAREGQCSSEKRKFWIALSREEIEEDIFIMTGSRPARRPRKRPKNVQKQMDCVFPGLWLVGVTAEAYRVADAPAKVTKKLRGSGLQLLAKAVLVLGEAW